MFKVGEIVWHPRYKRGEVAYSAGNDVRVMFEDAQFNPQITTAAPTFIKKEDLADMLRAELKRVEEELQKEWAEQDLPKEEKDKIRKERQDAVIRENESLKEQSKKAPLDGHTIYWEADIQWEVPTLPGGQPDPKYAFPLVSGYYRVDKANQPMGMHIDRKTGKLKFHAIEDNLDMNLSPNAGTGKFRVRILRTQLPVLPTARPVPVEELSVLMEEGDEFGSFFSK